MARMSTVRVAFLHVLLLASCPAAADSGDDFSNNLFSDLAPILTLFGERVVMQFMSQSMGWADNFMLAMAPIGIITIIVSAIRVGGPSWLKAIIGRARENLAVAEAELMSSTSKEVCELWNGQEIVRCMGSANIVELICLLPSDEARQDGQPKVRTCDLETAIKDEFQYLQKIDSNGQFDDQERANESYIPSNVDPASSVEKGCSTASYEASDIIIVKNMRPEAPNISLNCHGQTGRAELRAWAAFGTTLQLGVIIFSGFVTYRLRWQKDGDEIKGYAFPCILIGTIALVAGLLVCGHVVESSSDETRYRPGQGRKARIVWLQQKKVVGDQVFDSFAIFPNDERTIITTSSRAKGDTSSTTSPVDSNNPGNPASNASLLKDLTQYMAGNKLALKTIAGTVSGLCGFVTQFVGLRGMHYSASIAQLVAVLIMTGVRAFARRGLSKPPLSKRLTPGFELEWFAMTLGDLDDAPWLATSKSETDESNEKDESKTWAIVPVDAQAYDKLNKSSADTDAIQNQARQSLEVMRALSLLTETRGVAAAEAVSLARAIEITMDALLPCKTGGYSKGPLVWCLSVEYGRTIDQKVYFHLKQQNGKWKAFADEINAALSLWLYTIREAVENETNQLSAIRISPKIPNTQDDMWLRSTTLPEAGSLRLLGACSAALQRDLDWWIPLDSIRILEVEQDDSGSLELQSCRVTGHNYGLRDQHRRPCSTVKYLSQEIDRGTSGFLRWTLRDSVETYLATESDKPLEAVLAQHLFSAFMWMVAKTMPNPLDGVVDLIPHDNFHNTWPSFTLRNSLLSRMAQEVSSAGLGSVDEVLLSIIPPLSTEQKLPQVDGIICDLANKYCNSRDRILLSIDGALRLLWVHKIGRTFPAESVISYRATAVLMDYLRTLNMSYELVPSGNGDPDRVKRDLQDALRCTNRSILSELMGIYEIQGRGWHCAPVQEARCGLVERRDWESLFPFAYMYDMRLPMSLNPRDTTNGSDHLGWTIQHYAAARGQESGLLHLLMNGADINVVDLAGWTPLHYASQRGLSSIVQVLIEWSANVDAEGRYGWKPIHFAAMSGDCKTIQRLCKAGAKLTALDNYQNTCLHLAAVYGRVDAVELLVGFGIQVDPINLNCETPLDVSARLGHLGVVKLLAIKLKADRRSPYFWEAHLYQAARHGYADVVKVLLELGDGEPSSLARAKSLYNAAYEGHYDVVELLIKTAPNKVSAAEKFGRSLHGAAIGGQLDIIRLLVTNGANIEALDEDGQTPFEVAVKGVKGHRAWRISREQRRRKQVNAARLLAELGADTKGYHITDDSIQDGDGNDVLQ